MNSTVHEDMNRALSESETACELRRTKAEVAKAIVSIKALHAQLCSIRKDKVGKRMIGRDYEIDTQDYLVMTHLGKLLHTGFWRYHNISNKVGGTTVTKKDQCATTYFRM